MRDLYGNLAPIGAPGEIVQGGAGVARGYLGREELTRERFFEQDGGRFYQTGDLGRWLPDGNLEFFGRLDQQVKVRGFRVEPGDVEAALRTHPGVREAAVVAREDTLVAYAVCDLTHPSLAETDTEALENEQVERWRTLYDTDVYGQEHRDDPTFDTSGWNSSYTGEPIPAEEMREWADGTVSRVLSRLEEGARVLEIGCGTGLLLFRIAPHCREYVATDFSAAALAAAREGLERQPVPGVQMRQATADDFTGIEPGSFDAVVINSVVQYFPDAEYLAWVLAGAVEAVRPGGFVFVGDVRSLPLLDAFHVSVELEKAPPSREQLARRTAARREEDPELVIDPKLFTSLPGRWPRVSGIEVQLRRGRLWNELVRFRYDAVLTVEDPRRTLEWPSWEPLSPGALREKLLAEAPERAAVRRVPNARVAADLAVWELLQDDEGPETVEEIRREALTGGSDPEDFWALASELPYDVAVIFSAAGPGFFDVLLQRREEGRPAAFDLPVAASEPWERLTNHPLRRGQVRQAAPRLRAYLEERLPDYMVPSAVVLLDRLPLNVRGKLDRKALPAPDRLRPDLGEVVTPRTPTEEILAGLFAELLGIDRVGVRDGFFALGGHSLLATQLVSQIRQTFGVEIPLRSVFETPTVAGLAPQIESARQAPAAPPIVHEVRPPGAVVPLSFAQRRLWLLERLAPGSSVYNVASAVRFTGPLDERALAAAFNEIVRRHEVLRTTFQEEDGEPVQVAAPSLAVPMPVADLTALPRGRRDAEAERLAFAEARRPFDLARGPLVRLTLLWLGPRERVLLTSLHHIVSDAWSVGIFYRGLMELYGSFAAGQPATLPELAVQYADYAVWQRRWFQGETRQRELAWWARQLADLPALRLPGDRPRPARQTFRGVALTAILPVSSLGALARNWGATPFMLLLAAFQTLLHRHTGQEEIVVGSPVANRERAEIEGLIGFFVNTLVLRANLEGNPAFPELVSRVRELTLDAWAHQSLPFEMLVEALEPERDLSRQPLFQVMFQLQNVALPRFEIAGVAIEPLDVEPGTAHFDLGVDLMEMADGLLVSVRYAADLFDATTIRRLLAHFETLLRGIAADPGTRLGDLPLLSEAERHQVGTEWSDTAVETDRTPVHRRIAARAALQPDAPAVTFGGITLTYGELDRRADRLAAGLRALGVRRGSPVGLRAERSLDLPAAILAIWKTGGVFLPLDPGLPEARLAAMVEDAGALVWTGEVEAVEEGESEDVGPDDLAYLIYTSGTSGRPKAVAVEHGSLSNFVDVSLRSWGWDEADRMASLASFSFDIFLFELLVPLAAGGAVTLFPLRPLDVSRVARELPGLTRFHAVPALMRQIVQGIQNGHSISGLRTVFTGGDRVPDDLPAALRETFPGAEAVVLYGPTEGTVFCSSFRLPPGSDRVLLGRPAGNAILSVRDPYGNLAPAGASGEVVLGGPGVARGYLGREELTRERFFAQDGGRFYRTGDLGRWLADGNLEFLGRIDQQVKVRGFRVEPGEVEAALRTHPAVREAAVVAREDTPGDLRLVAYVTGELGELSLEEVAPRLRAYLAERLPDYMVPAAVVPLDRLPLTPHGKVDRRSLPAPERVRWDEERVAPRTPTEEILAGLFAEALGLDRVGVRDSFFALGGHSLLATQLVSRIRQAFGVEIELRAFFESPTVEGLAARIAAPERDSLGVPPLLPRVWRGPERPLSFSQRRLWFLDRLEPGNTTYNMLTALRIRGPLSLGVLAACLDEIARRHEVLRARIVAVEGQPVQLVEPAAAPGSRPLPLVDLSALPARRREPETQRLAAAETRRPFDLARGPLLRATALRLNDRGHRDHALFLTLHHIVSDGWSEAVLVREVATLYPAFAAGLPSPLAALPLSYADFAFWQREWLQGEMLAAQVAYWREALAGAPGRLELSTDFPRPPVPSGRGHLHVLEVPEATADAVRALCRRARTTPFMLLFAAFGTLLGRLAAQDDVLVGTPIANRTRTETEGLIGFFVNTLVLRADLRGEPTGRELLARVREAALGAYAHQDLPFERLVEELRPDRELARQPLFQAMFVLQNAPRSDFDVQGISLQPIGVDPGASKFDLTMALNETGGGYLGTIEYSIDLFAPSTMVSLAERYNRLLAAFAADPAAPVHALPLLHEGERHQLLREWNDTGALPAGACLHEMFEAQVDRTPDEVALVAGVAGEDSLTYRELDRLANLVAHRLRRLGVGPDVTVGLSAGRTARMVAGLLGILKAGSAYVPLDPGYPRERLDFLVADAGIRTLVTGKDLEGIDAEAGDPGRIAEAAGPDNLAYVIYTSGSTGVPKGVAVRHAGVTTLLAHMSRAIPAEALAGFLATTSISFDVSVFELFVPLIAGGTVILAENALAVLPTSRPITLFSTVPSAMAELLRAGAIPPSVTTVDLGGEAVPEEMVRQLLDRPGIERVYNLYGPTEDTVCSTFARLDRGGDGRVTIGRPIRGGRAYVLDARLQPVPAGTRGELHVGGAGVSRGYLHRPALTAERFLPDPFGEEPGGRLYRTGDLVRLLPDGRLDFLGRLDHQVKVRGFRIELGEIEASLTRHPAVREAAVLARRTPAGPALVAYVVAEGTPSAGELRAFLRERLPEPFVPAAFVLLPSLPLNPNGKVDRDALARIEPAASVGPKEKEKEAPRTPVEELLAAIWSEVLGVPRIGRDDDFFALSGHSLLAAQVAYRIESTFGVSLPLRRLFERATLAELALEIEAASRPGTKGELEPIVPVPRDRPLPVSFYQEWVWWVQGGPVSAIYNMPSAWRLRGRIDLAALGRAFAALLARHEVLRSRLLEVDGVILQEPVAVEVSLPVVDLEALPAEAAERETLRLARVEAERPFDLTRPPLSRALALRLTDENHALFVTIHHSAADGWSLGILQRELAALYAAATGRPVPLPDLPVQYADFARWQRERLDGEPLAAQLAYWRRRLAGLPPPLDLSAGRPRPERLGAGAVAADWMLPPALTAALRKLGQDTGCTLSMVLTAGLAALLRAATGQEDFTLASIFSGRTRPELQGLIGIFMNTVVLRANLSGGPTFRELLPRIRETVLEAYAHQDVSFPQLFAELFPGERLDRTRLARVVINMMSFEPSAERSEPAGPADVESFEDLDAQPHALYDLALMCQEHGEAVYCQLVGAAELFDAERLEAFGRHLTDLLTRAAADPDFRPGAAFGDR
ncbi:MAG TPA: amino acid adenylation domain-containing protein [Thermoanaerobaculia bacterium]|nr:amino acid adenylation domain-containing protein [Thermoanaerobaculia bacterium]